MAKSYKKAPPANRFSRYYQPKRYDVPVTMDDKPSGRSKY